MVISVSKNALSLNKFKMLLCVKELTLYQTKKSSN